MKCLFIVNPSSGTKTIQKKLDQFIGQCIVQQIVETVHVFYTEKKDDAYHKCLSLKEKEYDFIVGVGGDGTINEIISGLVFSHSHIPLAILAGGTVNDFATHMQLPTTPKSFVKMIKEFHISEVDVGVVNNRCFANVIAGGMFSDISFQVSKLEKERFGPLAYYVSGLRQLPQQLSTCLNLKITADEKYIEEDASLFMITNTSQVGGFKGVTPQASVQDGLLDLIIIKKCNPADLISVYHDYVFKNHQDNSKVQYLQAKNIHIECNSNIIYDIDGEEGTEFPIDVSVLKKQLKLITLKS